MGLAGIVRLHLTDGRQVDTQSTGENFVALNSFLKKPASERKANVKAGDELIQMRDIERTEFIEDSDDE